MTRPDVLEIHDPEVTRLFHDEEGAYYILQFAARPMTVEAAATNLRISASTIRRWLNRFMEYGLVKCVGVEKNRRYLYQLAAKQVVIHDDHPTLVTPEAYMQPVKARLDGFTHSATMEYNRQLEADPWVLVIQANGDEWAETVPMPRSQYTGSGQAAHALAFRNDWFDVVLTPEQARLFAAELLALKQRMIEASDIESGQTTYLVHLGFVKQHP